MDTIDHIRAFNRYYTRHIGLVKRDFLGTGLSLSELHVLYELAQPAPPNARLLAAQLGLDEGYLSRILAKFAERGWLLRRDDPKDRRRSFLSLTAAGKMQAEDFIGLARGSIQKILAGVPAIDQAKVVDAMTAIERLLSGKSGEVILRDLRPGDSGWLIQQHAEIYQSEMQYDQGLEALVAEILAKFIREHDPGNERAFIAVQDGARLGSIFCVRESATVARLRLLLLVPEARGLGLGQRLIDACLAFARARGYARMVLWTEANLGAACALYEKNGFRVTSEEKIHHFGVDAISQNWEITL